MGELMGTHTHRRSEGGSTLIIVLVLVVICSAIAGAMVVQGLAGRRETQAALEKSRAFHAAEAGVDWAVSQVRMRNGIAPTTPTETQAVSNGVFVVQYIDGETNGLDDDGDGFVDNSAEADFVIVRSTGTVGDQQRAVEVVLRRAVSAITVDAALQINVTSPIIDLNGNAFAIDGNDHGLDGVATGVGIAKAGIASPAAVADITSQIPAGRAGNITGLGGTPSVAMVPAIDLGTMMAQATASADVIIESGAHSNLELGEPTSLGAMVAFCNGDLRLSGGAEGAGVLVIEGDLTISGDFMWTGLVIVRGRVRMTGGGSTKRVVGALVVGEEITSEVGATGVTVSGTVDLLFSQAAVSLAANRMAQTSLLAWRVVGSTP